jgi:hypothetical protein
MVAARKRVSNTILETENVTLRYYPFAKIIHHELRRFVHGEEFRRVLDLGLEELSRNCGAKWLSDDRGNAPLKPADAEWALNDWAPRVMKAGWKYWAVLMPEKVTGKMNMRRWIETYSQQGVTVDVFDDTEEALVWLETR